MLLIVNEYFHIFHYFCISVVPVIPLFLLFFYFKLSLVNQTKTNDIRLNLYITIELIIFIQIN